MSCPIERDAVAEPGSPMALNLHGRDFLKEVDFTTAELQFLLDLSTTSSARRRRAPSGSGCAAGTSR